MRTDRFGQQPLAFAIHARNAPADRPRPEVRRAIASGRRLASEKAAMTRLSAVAAEVEARCRCGESDQRMRAAASSNQPTFVRLLPISTAISLSLFMPRSASSRASKAAAIALHQLVEPLTRHGRDEQHFFARARGPNSSGQASRTSPAPGSSALVTTTISGRSPSRESYCTSSSRIVS